MSGHAPFDDDIARQGAYQYTDGRRLSARMANERYTDMILASASFAGRTVLDVGAGDGTYTAELAQRSGCACVLGIEPSPNAVERAKEAFTGIRNLAFRGATSANLIEEGLHFNIAVYRGVLHHVDDPRGEAQRALQLADVVIFLEPNGLNPVMKIAERLSAYHRAHHERSFRPSVLQHWIMQAGGLPGAPRWFGLVPYFCPDAIAHWGRRFEPVIESVPVARSVCCGQYVLTAQAACPCKEAKAARTVPVLREGICQQ